MTLLDINQITECLRFLSSKLEITNKDFKKFMMFSNFPCSSLTININDENVIENDRVYQFDCKNAVEMLLVFDVKQLNDFLFPDLSKCSSLQSLVYSGWNENCTYNFRHQPYLNRITINAPLQFLYKYCFKDNVMLETVVFYNFVDPLIIWYPIQHLSELKTLVLVNCGIREVPDHLDFTSLRTLKLSNNHLKEIPPVLKNFKNLYDLDISFNKIKHLPNWVTKLKLRNLNLNNNSLQHFPVKIIQKMKFLQQICLKNNCFEMDMVFFKQCLLDTIEIHTDVQILNENEKQLYDQIKTLNKEPPTQYICPISREIMVNPVISLNGFTYDKYHIEKWFEVNDIEPCTGLHVVSKQVIPNLLMKEMISSFVSMNQ
jgi:hypothetical protein